MRKMCKKYVIEKIGELNNRYKKKHKVEVWLTNYLTDIATYVSEQYLT